MLPLMCSHPLAAGMGGPVSVVSSTTASSSTAMMWTQWVLRGRVLGSRLNLSSLPEDDPGHQTNDV